MEKMLKLSRRPGETVFAYDQNNFEATVIAITVASLDANEATVMVHHYRTNRTWDHVLKPNEEFFIPMMDICVSLASLKRESIRMGFQASDNIAFQRDDAKTKFREIEVNNLL